jgi:hypothetical protein
MGVIEPIAIGLGIHLGKKVIDWVWQSIQAGSTPVANQKGAVGFTTSYHGRTSVGKDFTINGFQANELVIGKLFLPDTIRATTRGNEIALIMITEETTLEAFLFAADTNAGYEIYLPHGLYSFYVFLMDSTCPDFLSAEIYAIGFPSALDLSQFSDIEMESHDDIWDLVSDFPIMITQGGPYNLDLILINTDLVPELPKSFNELLGEAGTAYYDLTGAWKLTEEYEFGSTQGDLYLLQSGNQLSGLVRIEDQMDDGTKLLLEQTISGQVQGDAVYLAGTSVRALKGWIHDYELDCWDGVLNDRDTIVGVSEDLAGTSGAFILERIYD